jgi:hypothetical protein
VRVRHLNWMQLEAYLGGDDRIVLPVGSTEQHAYLSLETDNILAERASLERAIPFKRCPFTLLGREAFLSLGTLRIVCVLPEARGSLVEQRSPLVGGRGANVFAKRHVCKVLLFWGE